MDYLIDRYERVLKFFKIGMPTVLSFFFIVGIIGLFNEATRGEAIGSLALVLVLPPAAIFETKLIRNRIDELEEMTIDPSVNVSLLIAKERYIMELRSEKFILVFFAVVIVFLMLVFYVLIHNILLAILIPLIIATPGVLAYLIHRRFLKREVEKAEEFLNTPNNN